MNTAEINLEDVTFFFESDRRSTDGNIFKDCYQAVGKPKVLICDVDTSHFRIEEKIKESLLKLWSDKDIPGIFDNKYGYVLGTGFKGFSWNF